tara:strand:+ start:3840 stop:5168 length:1329 start_codon:yes stop_codon:yes gene_type:complete
MTLKPTVVDLFCGAGGLSAGFQSAGYSIIGGLDSWGPAVSSFALNKARARAVRGDVREIDESEFLGSLTAAPDVVLGGPSCQGFSTSSGLSRSGRKKDDPRNSHFMHFIRLVNALSPGWVVMENVTGLLLFNRGDVAHKIIDEFAKIGYKVIPMILLAADFGVPQLRRRLFFVGNRTAQPISFPMPTNGNPDLWKNFALPFEHLSRIGNKSSAGAVAPHVSIADAISDLPIVKPGEQFDEAPYPGRPESAFQRRMRRYSRRLSLHVAAQLSAFDATAIPHIGEGQNWTALPENVKSGRFSRIRSYDATTLMKRPKWDGPSYTITTKTNDATAGPFIHPRQDRTLTLREAARLQSFPDNYKFFGTHSEIRKQIGNAVPPLLGERIARAILPEVLEYSGLSTSQKSPPRLTFDPVTDVHELIGLKKPRKRQDGQGLLFAGCEES